MAAAPRHGPWKSPSLALAQTGRLSVRKQKSASPSPPSATALQRFWGERRHAGMRPRNATPPAPVPTRPTLAQVTGPAARPVGQRVPQLRFFCVPAKRGSKELQHRASPFAFCALNTKKEAIAYYFCRVLRIPSEKRGEEKERWGERGEKTEEGPGPETAAEAGRWGGGHGGRALLSEGKAPAPSRRRAPHRTASPSSTSGHPVKSECHVSVK